MRSCCRTICSIVCGLPSAAQAESPAAKNLRSIGDLVPYSPAQSILGAHFVADEAAPTLVYGPVSAYQKTRACPTTGCRTV